MSRKDDFACFVCDYGWILLILLMLIFTGIVTKNIWGPYVFPPTPTTVPTRTPVSTLSPPTSTSIPTLTPTLTSLLPTEQVLGSGDVQITLRWVGRNDLDLHVVDPAGEEIYYDHRLSQSGGDLDVDSNKGCHENITEQSVENIFWPTGNASTGSYQIYVVYYKKCMDVEITNFTVHVLVDGDVKDFTGQVDTLNDRTLVYQFTR